METKRTECSECTLVRPCQSFNYKFTCEECISRLAAVPINYDCEVIPEFSNALVETMNPTCDLCEAAVEDAMIMMHIRGLLSQATYRLDCGPPNLHVAAQINLNLKKIFRFNYFVDPNWGREWILTGFQPGKIVRIGSPGI